MLFDIINIINNQSETKLKPSPEKKLSPLEIEVYEFVKGNTDKNLDGHDIVIHFFNLKPLLGDAPVCYAVAELEDRKFIQKFYVGCYTRYIVCRPMPELNVF